MRDIKTQAEIANMSDMQIEKHTSPLTVFDYVRASDVDNVNYVSGSEGQVKTLIEYGDLDESYIVTTTTFKYAYLDFPTKVSSIEVV